MSSWGAPLSCTSSWLPTHKRSQPVLCFYGGFIMQAGLAAGVPLSLQPLSSATRLGVGQDRSSDPLMAWWLSWRPAPLLGLSRGPATRHLISVQRESPSILHSMCQEKRGGPQYIFLLTSHSPGVGRNGDTRGKEGCRAKGTMTSGSLRAKGQAAEGMERVEGKARRAQ